MAQFMDPASGVFSEEAFQQCLAREASRATRYQDLFALCLVKPDGVAAGDERLQGAVAQKIAGSLRSTDIVGRAGGSIGALLVNTPAADAVRVADRIRAHVGNAAFRLEGEEPEVRLTVSVGLAAFPRDGSSHGALLARARTNLEAASRGGGDGVVYE
jgi:diguanylate cyclase (GGDEF)-like protein